MQVIATATGYDNVAVRNEGDIFACPKNAKGQDIIGNKPDGTPKVSWYKEYHPGHHRDGYRLDANGKPVDGEGRPLRTDDRGRAIDAHGRLLPLASDREVPDASGRGLNPDGTPRTSDPRTLHVDPRDPRDPRDTRTPGEKKRDGRDLA